MDINIKNSKDIKEIIQNLPEYLITNGLGGYASSTILNLNTRKYHGLLIAGIKESSGINKKYVILSGIDEKIEIDGKIYELGTHHYKMNYDPNNEDIFSDGFKFLKKYEYEIFPKFYYEVEKIKFEKEILMPYLSNTVIVHYKFKNFGNENIKFFIYPLISARPYHQNLHINESLLTELENKIFVTKKIKILSNSNFYKSQCILKNVFYENEWKRGYDCFEDLYCPGFFSSEIKENIYVIVTIDDFKFSWENLADEIKEREILRIKNIQKNIRIEKTFQDLSILADKFIVKYSNGYGIIAGYHWFEEWGRDTMISIPGLTLSTKRYEISKSILERWIKFMHNGLIPNFINDSEFSLNSSDATLWLFNSLYYFYLHTGDTKFIEKIYENLIEAIESYIEGNEAAKMDDDCLIISKSQTTWMDTKFTKREGKAVEINALWFNALSILKFFSKIINKNFQYQEILENLKKNFEIFWNENKECLYDVVNDASIRPNQIFAISLPFSIINDKRAEKIFNIVLNELYTPYGLRSLSKNDKSYIGVYEGDVESRDKSYHNGTVWPWLIGNFIDAYLKINNYTIESKQNARKFLNPLLEYFKKFKTIPEIFDGDFPHNPKGCIAQAWSVAEVIRAFEILFF